MHELEAMIAEWRKRMMAALPEREEAVDELEEHLREHVTTLQRRGMSDEQAFAASEKMLGEPQAVSREFDRMPAGWLPGSILLTALALCLAVMLGFLLFYWSRRQPLTVLYSLLSGVNLAGIFGVLGSGLVAGSAALISWWRPLHERERRGVRIQLKRLARLAVACLPIGFALSILWRSQLTPGEWANWSHSWRGTGAVISATLLLAVQSRRKSSDRVRWGAAILASLGLLLFSFSPHFRIANIPVASLGLVFLTVQIFLILPRIRIVIDRAPE